MSDIATAPTPGSSPATLARTLHQHLAGKPGRTVRRFDSGRVELRETTGLVLGTYGSAVVDVLLENGTLVETSRGLDSRTFMLDADAPASAFAGPAEEPDDDPTDEDLEDLDVEVLLADEPPTAPTPAEPATAEPATPPTPWRYATLPALGSEIVQGQLMSRIGTEKGLVLGKRVVQEATSRYVDTLRPTKGRLYLVNEALVALLQEEGFDVVHEPETVTPEAVVADVVEDVEAEGAGDAPRETLADAEMQNEDRERAIDDARADEAAAERHAAERAQNEADVEEARARAERCEEQAAQDIADEDAADEDAADEDADMGGDGDERLDGAGDGMATEAPVEPHAEPAGIVERDADGIGRGTQPLGLDEISDAIGTLRAETLRAVEHGLDGEDAAAEAHRRNAAALLPRLDAALSTASALVEAARRHILA